ncbi:uncharacterized protein CDV56_103715 [Aspergillus thermomutatus]|uniref:Tc toxin complex TcA C-terminal TcB-binding domain-containing protein n=1 Tax=Aspergillus thermomutatus TaxID=41047 RepID=A0A397GLA1_ASPTH|nr:uncharacterized protein CDV56_103715 [Aspergillus thermomutatus]RHZ51791.1 hypothetical protein CDV56_103715 [Aspergillus thermomutatus]
MCWNDRYGPFEGAEAISTWRISLLRTHQQFDYNTIGDVVLHLRYTAFGSGGSLEKNAFASVDAWVKQSPDVSREYGKGANVFAIDLKNDYLSEWWRVASTGCMTLHHIDQRLPFWARRGRFTSENISLLITPEPSAPGDIKITIPGQADIHGAEDGKLGDYFKFTFPGKPVAEASTPWTMHIKSDRDGF